jgi:hypothetical protein
MPVRTGPPHAARLSLALAVLAALSCCTAKPKSTPPLPINPTPTRPGQAVIFAGNGESKGGPVNGAYAVRTAVPVTGGIASAADGSLYFPVGDGEQSRLARLTPDGRIHLIGDAAEGDGLLVSGDTLWEISPADLGTGLIIGMYRIKLKDGTKSVSFELNEQTISKILITDEAGKPLSTIRREDLRPSWNGSIAGLSNGKPILINRHGDLFRVLDSRHLELWEPAGYRAALKRVTRPDADDADQDLRPASILNDVDSTTILGDPGLIRIPRLGSAQGTQFSWLPDHTRTYFHATGAVRLSNGTLLVVDGSTGDIKPLAKVTPDGTVASLTTGRVRDCGSFSGTLDDVAAGRPMGISKRPDGTFAVSDTECNRIYVFRPPT